jgi:hypothetical protein
MWNLALPRFSKTREQFARARRCTGTPRHRLPPSGGPDIVLTARHSPSEMPEDQLLAHLEGLADASRSGIRRI